MFLTACRNELQVYNISDTRTETCMKFGNAVKAAINRSVLSPHGPLYKHSNMERIGKKKG